MTEKADNRSALIDDLAELCGCLYISDLHTDACKERLSAVLADGFEIDNYSAEQWSLAVTYILRESLEFFEPAEAVSLLKERIG